MQLNTRVCWKCGLDTCEFLKDFSRDLFLAAWFSSKGYPIPTSFHSTLCYIFNLCSYNQFRQQTTFLGGCLQDSSSSSSSKHWGWEADCYMAPQHPPLFFFTLSSPTPPVTLLLYSKRHRFQISKSLHRNTSKREMKCQYLFSSLSDFPHLQTILSEPHLLS